MNYYQERIETDSILPARIYIKKSQGINSRYPLHWHDNLEFDLVLEGKIIGSINGKRIEVNANDFFFVNSGDLHETDADSSMRMSSITVLISYNLVKEYCPDMDSYYFDFTDKDVEKEEIKAILLECANVYEEKKEYYELEISILLRKLCLHLLRSCKNRKQEDSYSRYEMKSRQNIKRIISYLEKNYESYLSLDMIAEEVGMTRSYFSRFFKKATGENFYTYLTNMRLYHAHKELMSMEESITDVALNNGFANVKSFIEAFKKNYNMTPARYKKNQE
jgi:AraC-like DNA-binding protein